MSAQFTNICAVQNIIDEIRGELDKKHGQDPGGNGMTDMKCYYCSTTCDLRPYGPRGAMVCFSCATSTPEREAETKRNFGAQLDAAGPVALIDGAEVGPYPVKHHPQAAEALQRMREGLEGLGARQ